MSDERQITEPGEMVYLPKPSWAPAFLALGALALVCGTFASGFIFAPYIYGILGAVIALAAFRGVVRGAIRDYYGLPRKQRVRNAALPIETVRIPER